MAMITNPVHHTVRKQMLGHKLSVLKHFNRDPYSCPKYKYKIEAPIETVLEFEQEDERNGLPISPPL